MKPYSRQKSIAAVFRNDRKLVLRRKEILELTAKDFYHMAQATEAIARMVENGLLKRVKRGYYRLGKLRPSYRTTVDIDADNQLELF